MWVSSSSGSRQGTDQGLTWTKLVTDGFTLRPINVVLTDRELRLEISLSRERGLPLRLHSDHLNSLVHLAGLFSPSPPPQKKKKKRKKKRKATKTKIAHIKQNKKSRALLPYLDSELRVQRLERPSKSIDLNRQTADISHLLTQESDDEVNMAENCD